MWSPISSSVVLDRDCYSLCSYLQSKGFRVGRWKYHLVISAKVFEQHISWESLNMTIMVVSVWWSKEDLAFHAAYF